MKILITGGLGAVGKPLVSQLKRRGNQVWVLDKSHSHLENYFRADVGEFRQVQRIFEHHKFDIVYHLAAEFGRKNGEDFYESLWKTNAVGTKNILKIQEKYRFRLVFTSSSEIYADYPNLMKENVPEKYPLQQLNDYAISKWVNELQILNSQKREKTETVRVRLFNTYGPGEFYSEYRSVICRFVYCVLHDKPYTVYLNHHRSSTFISDTVRTLANISVNFYTGKVYNIAGDEYHDIKTLSDMILSFLYKDDIFVTYKELDEFNTLNKKADNSLAKKDLHHENEIDLKTGIKRTIEWQKEIYNV